MNKNSSESQMRTLSILIAILALVIAVQYFYKPIIQEKKNIEEQINITIENKNKMKTNLNYYEGDLSIYEEEKELLAENRSQFLNVMENSAIDSIFSEMIIQSGLHSISLEIDENGEDEVISDDDSIHTTGVRTCDFTYVVSGKYTNLLQFIDKINNNLSMEIKNFQFNNNGEFTAECEFEASITIRVYMYDEKFDISLIIN